MAVPFLSARIRRPFFTISFQFYFSYKNSSGSVTPKSFARWRNSSGVIVWRFVGCMESVFTRISADFSAVCISPKVRSKSNPAANIPWCAQTFRPTFFTCRTHFLSFFPTTLLPKGFCFSFPDERKEQDAGTHSFDGSDL